MASFLEYDFGVNRLIPVSVALFVFSVFLAPRGYAQFNTPGAPTGHIVTGTAPSVTGPVRPPTGPVRPPTGIVPNVNSLVPSRVTPNSGAGSHHHHHHKAEFGPVWYAVPVPYPVDGIDSNDAADNPDENDSDNYQGGPTVFDRRGDGADSYVPPVDDVSSSRVAGRTQDATSNADAPQPTTLVFKDGHKLEVINYAIIGAMLFDMTPGHARKVPLADLDLEATQEQNEERGVTFQLPMSSQAN
jgi:hypothetical protein